MSDKKLTTEEALQNIGIALGHESLRLSQAEHLTLINSFNVIKEALLEKKK